MEVLQNFKNLFFDVWEKGISGVNISEILIALGIFLFFLFLRGIFSKFIVKRLENYVSKTTNNFDNSLVYSMEGPAKFFPIVLGFFVSTSYLTIETQAAEFLETINRVSNNYINILDLSSNYRTLISRYKIGRRFIISRFN